MQGGKRRKIKHREGQKALLDAIWTKCGGASAVAKVLGIHSQAPINWRNRGGVPLVDCKRVASALNIPVFGLNYEELSKFYDKDIPLWDDVIKKYMLPPMVENRILSLKDPILED